jgi:hypothetical protein
LFILVKEMTTAWLRRNMVIFLGLVQTMTNEGRETVTERLTMTSNLKANLLYLTRLTIFYKTLQAHVFHNELTINVIEIHNAS